jgi:dTDP-4-amino-4,6-dideoxygalactose transaminase
VKKNIPFIVPHPPLLKELEKDFQQVYKNGWFTNMGPFEKKFEKELGLYLNYKAKIPRVVAVSSATMGIILALKALEPKRQLVLLPSFTFAATVEAVIWCGYEPLFVDIDEDSWSMAIDTRVTKLIKDGKVGAVVYGNPFGIPGDIDEWIELTQYYSIPLLIDSAAGVGSKYPDGVPMGLKGSAEVFSLHITKTFGIGEGGLVVTKDKSLAKKIQSMKNFGFDKNHIVQTLGLNAKMPEFSSVIGLHVLASYESVLRQKRKLMRLYLRYLAPSVKTHKDILLSAGMFFPILFPIKSLRDLKEHELVNFGVETRRYYYPPLHQHPPFRNIKSVGSLKNTENIVQRILVLPLHLDLIEDHIKAITEIINH